MDERDDIIKETAKRDVAMWGNDIYTVAMEREPGQSGVTDANHTIRSLPGYNVVADNTTGDKDTRLKPFASQVRAGNVLVLSGQDWTQRFLGTMSRTYPGSKRDRDIPDATAGAFNCMNEVIPVGAA